MFEEDIITRYMSIEKFLDFITKGELFLARYDSFEDKMEGHSVDQLAKKWNFKWEHENGKKLLPSSVRRKLLFGSCWYHGDENLAMWDRYKSERGVAIQMDRQILISDFTINSKKLFYPLNSNLEKSKLQEISSIYTGFIDYLNENEPPQKKRFRFGLVKHSAFSHENEFRFVLRQRNLKNRVKADNYIFKIPSFKKRIIKIITNPYMSEEFTEMIKAYVIKKTGEGYKEVMESKYRKLFK